MSCLWAWRATTISLATVLLSPVSHAMEMADKTFDREAARLYWDVTPEIRLEYLYSCQSHYQGRWFESSLHELDIFGRLSYLDALKEVQGCNGVGLEVNYQLSGDGRPPSTKKLEVTLNGNELSFYDHGNQDKTTTDI